MARPRQPIDLIVKKGKAHLTKAQIEQRKKEEIRTDDLKNVKPPEYLPEKLKKEFDEISEKLLQLEIMTELDEDTLARYLLAKQQYLQYTVMLNRASAGNNLNDMERLARLQDKAYRQCRAGAADLGLTISSRCKLVVPKVEAPKENKFLARFGGQANAR